MTPLGIAGRIARAFVHSKLTPLAIVSSVLLGVYAVLALPREEEPQIVVPMVDVFLGLPGASPAEVEQRLTRPVEKRLAEVTGVEYIYSTSSAGQATIIVRFLVGQPVETALVRLREKLATAADLLPPGATTPVVRARSIDDVPIMALTLWGSGYDDARLRAVGAQLAEALKQIPNVAEVTLIGGRSRQVSVELDSAALEARGLTALDVSRRLAAADAAGGGLQIVSGDRATRVEAGRWLETADDVRNTPVAAGVTGTVYVGDVAIVSDGPAEPTSYVQQHPRKGESFPAVTLAIAKRPGTNAITVTDAIGRTVDTMRGVLLPRDLQVSVTRNYGETAASKSNELLWHMLIAVVSVSALIWLTLGRRESAVVLIAIPVTLALTLFVFQLYGYTLNRITLFALIFSIGILVDDAIVIVENIARHLRLSPSADLADVAVRAVDEVGNPTILATLTVVAAILPMAFVGGLMGPYMRPIPVGASAAMLFSLAVAFVVTPWAAARLLRRGTTHGGDGDDWLTSVYRKAAHALLRTPRTRVAFLAGVVLLLVAAAALVPLQLVTVKMLPFDNKSDLQVVVRMPDDSPLERTAAVVGALADSALDDPSVTSVQSYAGTAAPYTFNGLVRHYFLRQASSQGDLQITLTAAEERSAQSHDIAGRLRTRLRPVADALGAVIQVVEVPPGPPVLQTLVAEIYGPDAERRLALARQVRDRLAATPGVVDVDWYVDTSRPLHRLELDVEHAGAGIASTELAQAIAVAGAGTASGRLHDPIARETVPIVVRLPRAQRGNLDEVDALPLAAGVAIRDATRLRVSPEPQTIYHKNLMPVTYVTADVAGEIESPVYAILQLTRALEGGPLPEGYGLEIFHATQPDDSNRYAMKWDGEWHITIEVFRDLGLAFAAVLVLIYVLVVAWFQSFTTPLTIMLAIPFSLVGILPAHAALGAFFTATSMIGFIAGAGIVVRNSIILVDFIELRVRDGMPLAEAVVDAGAVRFRPMALTAAAVIAGSAVILFDPIFQGLAISLMAGEVASLLLSRMTVPLTYYMTHRTSGRTP
jgi:multidrug efflux pump subunit AcrB